MNPKSVQQSASTAVPMKRRRIDSRDVLTPWPGTCFLFVVVMCSVLGLSLYPGNLLAGTITLQADSTEPILSAWAVQRVQNDTGLYSHELPGRIELAAKSQTTQSDDNQSTAITSQRIVFDDLPAGHYDLKFQTKTGVIQGWNAKVPESDYEIEQPLKQSSIDILCHKLTAGGASGFDDQVAVLDIQGNVQNAAILTRHLRTRAFTGGKYKKGEWVFRVTRWQWESPDEITWAPWQERPFYAMIRQRLFRDDYNALRITYARHLGGLTLKTETSKLDLGKVILPKVQPTICAVNPDGSVITPIIIKPVSPKGVEDEK